MIKSTLMSLAFIATLYSSNIYAEEFSKDENRQFAIEMSKCMGAQEANADLFKQMQEKSLAERTSGLARGTRIAARYLFFQAGVSPENLDKLIDSYAYKTKLTVSADFEYSFPKGKNPKIAKEILDNCSKKWMPLQESIVEQKRRLIYK